MIVCAADGGMIGSVRIETRSESNRGRNTMELWDIYNENKQKTGRTMKRNDWNMKAGDYH